MSSLANTARLHDAAESAFTSLSHHARRRHCRHFASARRDRPRSDGTPLRAPNAYRYFVTARLYARYRGLALTRASISRRRGLNLLGRRRFNNYRIEFLETAPFRAGLIIKSFQSISLSASLTRVIYREIAASRRSMMMDGASRCGASHVGIITDGDVGIECRLGDITQL